MKQKCLYCGANPVPHRLFWMQETMNVITSPVNRWLSRTWLNRAIGKIIDFIMPGIFWFLEKLGAIKYESGIENARTSRAKFLWQEAIARNIEMQAIKFLGKPIDCYRAMLDGKWLYFISLPRPGESEAVFWMDDKYLLKKKLFEHNLPVAKGGSFTSYRKALAKFQELEKPLIVKPRLGSRGRHTTTFIYTEEQFEKAFKLAKQLCYWVIVEEHLVGPVFRGTVIGGKLAGVLGGDPPRIIGDGAHNIAELIEIKNANKHPKVKDIVVTDATKYFLQRNSLSMDSVLPAGKTIDLTEKIGISYGGTSYEIIDITHPDTKEMFVRAAEVVNDPLVGFDFIIEDITKSYKEQKCGIIECNGMPFINLHHDPLYGTPQNAAALIWDLFMVE